MPLGGRRSFPLWDSLYLAGQENWLAHSDPVLPASLTNINLVLVNPGIEDHQSLWLQK